MTAHVAPAWVGTCEHASGHVPAKLVPAFAAGAALLGQPASEALAGHRGHDVGARELALALAAWARVRPILAPVSRLVVDTNRSRRHPKLFSPVTRALPRRLRLDLVETFWWPHVTAVQDAVARAIGEMGHCVHVAWHSFTSVWQGVPRAVDIGLLYDPSRPGERALAGQVQRALAELAPQLRVRRNVPYRGTSDGLPTQLRRQHGAAIYAGMELEVNQALVADTEAWPGTAAALVAAARVALGRHEDCGERF